MFFRKKTRPIADPSAKALIQRMSAPTHMLLEAMASLPADSVLRVLSSTLRDRKDMKSKNLRKLAQELDQHADALERAGK